MCEIGWWRETFFASPPEIKSFASGCHLKELLDHLPIREKEEQAAANVPFDNTPLIIINYCLFVYLFYQLLGCESFNASTWVEAMNGMKIGYTKNKLKVKKYIKTYGTAARSF